MVEAPAGSGHAQDGQPDDVNVTDSFVTTLELCYEILLYLASRMARLQPGERFEFITADPTATDKIPDWCDLRGFTLLDSGPAGNGRQRFIIQK